MPREPREAEQAHGGQVRAFAALLLFGTAVAVLTVIIFRNFRQLAVWLALAALVACAFAVALALVQNAREKRRRRQREAVRIRVEHIVAAVVKDPESAAARRLLRPHAHRLRVLRRFARRLPPRQRDTLRRVLRELGVDRWLERQLRQGAKWRRVHALLQIGWLGADQALPAVYASLADPDDDVAWAATRILTRFDHPVAYCVLLELLEDDRFPASRIATLLERAQYRDRVGRLTQRSRSAEARTRFWVAHLLGQLGDPRALGALARLCRDAEPNVRANAAEAVGTLGSERGVRILLARLDDPEWFVRAHAARALGDLRAASALPALLPLLRDAHWWVRQNTAEALVRIGPPAMPLLERMLHDADRFARNKAAEVLTRGGYLDERVAVLARDNGEVADAQQDLIALGQAGAVCALSRRLVAVEAPLVQQRLIEIAEQVADRRLLPALQRLHETGQQVVRAHALRAAQSIEKGGER
ncbi:MAG: HEAT repeat domain-containing protein [Longimicrobiales bacterium]